MSVRWRGIVPIVFVLLLGAGCGTIEPTTTALTKDCLGCWMPICQGLPSGLFSAVTTFPPRSEEAEEIPNLLNTSTLILPSDS
jgi:hypothetical protein